MIYWAPLFHFYQPPIQIHSVLERVCQESYRPLLEVFRQFPEARATVNINGVLTEHLHQHGFGDVIEGLKGLAEAGQIEFTDSGKYHPILPLIPHEEQVRQIKLNYATNRQFLGPAYNPTGFFPPELAFSPEILPALLESRHEWVLAAGVACPVSWPLDIIHQVGTNHENLNIFFRDDILSNKISFQTVDGPGFIDHLRALGGRDRDIYVITAMDAETFGHHIEHWERLFLAEVYQAIAVSTRQEVRQQQVLAEQTRGILSYRPEKKEEEIRMVTISQLLALFPKGKLVEPRVSSWSTSEEDIKAGNLYPLWKDPSNPVHQLQWEHLEIAMNLLQLSFKLADTEPACRYAGIARGLLDAAVHSCQFWWASKRPYWDINLVNRGILQQEEVILNAYKAIQTSGAPQKEKRQAYFQVLISHELRDRIRDHLFMTE